MENQGFNVNTEFAFCWSGSHLYLRHGHRRSLKVSGLELMGKYYVAEYTQQYVWHEKSIWNCPVNCDKCVYWLLPLCRVENVWWWHICMTRTQSQLCSHTCISHSITDKVSNVSPLKELYTTNLRLANMRVLPPSLYDPDGSCLVLTSSDQKQNWTQNCIHCSRVDVPSFIHQKQVGEGGCESQYCQLWCLMTGLPRIFDKVNIKTFPSNVKSLCVVTSEMLKCCYSLDFKHFTEFRSQSSYWTY